MLQACGAEMDGILMPARCDPRGFREGGEMYQLVHRRQTDPALEFLTTPGVWPEMSRIHAGFRRIAPSVIRCYSVAVNREFTPIYI